MLSEIKNLKVFLLATYVLLPVCSSYALDSDKDQPIEISADNAERDEKMGVTLYHGNVIIKQGSLLILADTVTMKTMRSPITQKEELDEIITLGTPSHFQQLIEIGGDTAEATAKTIFYKVDQDQVTLIENAELKQAGRIISGDRIIYDIVGQKVLARGEVNSEKPVERVKVVIPPKIKVN